MLSCSVVIGWIVIDIFGNGGGVVHKTAGLDGAESGAVHFRNNLLVSYRLCKCSLLGMQV